MVARCIALFSIIAALICCAGCLPQDEYVPTETTPSVATEPSLQTLPTEIPPGNTSALIIDEHFDYLTSQMELHIFILMFGEDCVRQSQDKTYAIVQRESGEEYFVLFDKNGRLNHMHAAKDVVFITNDVMLDFLLGSNISVKDLIGFPCFRCGSGDKYFVYTEEGVFLLTFNIADYSLWMVEYYDYEDIPEESTYYTDRMWYILPEDRNQYN